MADNKEESVPLRLECHCKTVQATAYVPASALPMSLYICHCCSCNSYSGTICATVIQLPPGGRLENNGKAKSYKTSDSLERFFCPSCGTSVYETASGSTEGTIYLDSGAFASPTVQVNGNEIPIAKIDEQIFVDDTLDGGLRDWLTGTVAWSGWSTESTSIPQGKLWGPVNPNLGNSGEQVAGRCHCSGVLLTISPPADHGRHAAFLCACNDCRRASGFEISAWAIVPDGYLSLKRQETLKTFQSSEKTQRAFCGVCGALVLATSTHHPGKTFVGVGLLNDKDSKSGHRNQSILDWRTSMVNFEGDEFNKPLVRELSKGLKKWGEQSV